jgi:site-specific DNA-methyltransferase (adenine-specific)
MHRFVKGFMGAAWDGGDIAFRPETWATVATIMRAGAFLVAFGGTRTHHRVWCAIEDAGFVIQDTIMWLFGSGFPKSQNPSLEYEKRLCRQVEHDGHLKWVYRDDGAEMRRSPPYRDQTANEWAGRGTMLKPAFEPICLAYKPGGKRTMQVDECRVAGSFESGWSKSGSKASDNIAMSGANYERGPKPDNAIGRWPANICLSPDGGEYELRPGVTAEQKAELYRWLSENS